MRSALSIRKADIYLLAGGVMLLLLALLCVHMNRAQGAYAVVYIDGERISQYPLDIDMETGISTDFTNVLRISHGKASVIEADCPDGICVRTGEICYDGESIICLPHRLEIRIEGGASDGVDIH